MSGLHLKISLDIAIENTQWKIGFDLSDLEDYSHRFEWLKHLSAQMTIHHAFNTYR